MSKFQLIDPEDPDTLPPEYDRYAVVYQQGNIVRRFIADFDHPGQWMIGMPDVQILAWAELPEIPEEVAQ